MTIVIWDGKTLVADRRRTNSRCKNPEYQYSASTKIQIFSGLDWEPGEPILAGGFSGSVKQIDDFLNFLKGISPESSASELVSDHFKSQYVQPHFHGILVTSKRSLRFPDLTRGVVSHSHGDECLLAIGMHTSAVIKLSDLLNGATAFELVFLSMGLSTSVGDGINYWSLKNPVIRKKQFFSLTEKIRLTKKFQTAIQKLTLENIRS